MSSERQSAIDASLEVLVAAARDAAWLYPVAPPAHTHVWALTPAMFWRCEVARCGAVRPLV